MGLLDGLNLPTEPNRDLRKPAKGAARKARKKQRTAADRAFRDAVWLRAEDAEGEAYCEVCGAGPLLRTLEVMHPRAGHVAHARGRRVAPDDRFNPDKALLKCRDCHLGTDHHMRFAR